MDETAVLEGGTVGLDNRRLGHKELRPSNEEGPELGKIDERPFWAGGPLDRQGVLEWTWVNGE